MLIVDMLLLSHNHSYYLLLLFAPGVFQELFFSSSVYRQHA